LTLIKKIYLNDGPIKT